MSDAKLLDLENLVGKYFIGNVVDNNDPIKLCRVKVMVPELFSGYSVEALPWMACTQRVFRGQTGDSNDLENSPRCGPVFIPRVGSRVLCTFDKGSINSGIVREELVDGKMSNDPELLEDYPDTYGWTDENNTKLVVNTKQKTLHINHRGVTIDIDADGNLSVFTRGTTDVVSDGDVSISTEGSMMVSSKQDMTLIAQGVLTMVGSTIVSEASGS